MKLERLPEYVLPTMAMLGGLAFALFCGHLVGEGKTGMLLLVLYGTFLLALLLIMKARIWLLIPLAWPLGGQIPELPLPFAVRDLAVLSVFSCFLLLKAFKIVRHKPKMEIQDFWLLVMLLYLASVLIRNPVGLEALGSERVGGRPYLNIVVAALAYWVLARVTISSERAYGLPLILMAGPLLEAGLSLVTQRFPSTVPLLSRFYSSLDVSNYNAQDLRAQTLGQSTNRQTYLGNIGLILSRAMCAWFRPFTLINPLYFFRCIVFFAAVFCILASGFRSLLVMAGVTFFLCSYFRRGMSDVIRLMLIALPLLAVLLAMQGRLFQLPLAAQRALSFLPGKWDQLAVHDAKASTEWRVRMWKDSLFTDKYIHSKTLGDGFGLTRRQVEFMAANSFSLSDEDQQEHYLMVGGVHSGPVSAIRYVGAVGLIIFTGLMIAMAREAWRLVVRAKQTSFFAASLFIGVPIIWEPFNYYLVFGSFDSSMPSAVFYLGMLKMLRNSLDAHDARTAQNTSPNLSVRPDLAPGLRPVSPVGTLMNAPR